VIYFIDIAYDSLNKNGEELCGDKVEVIKVEDGAIIVLADGLGSGVKANILATLTSKIAATMLRGGADLFETVDTIANTLPACRVRNIAYSTFTIIKIYNDGRVYTAEYDNPPFFFIREGRSLKMDKKSININGRTIWESHFKLKPGDIITAVSDGVIHAGIGNVLNLGWQWPNVEDYLIRSSSEEKCAKNISRNLVETCWMLYGGNPGDDTTVVSVMARRPAYLDMFTGPPQNLEDDTYVIERLMRGRGKKIVCGGTAANIAARELKKELKVSLEFYDPEVPPTASIEGIDLTTEGVLTLSKTVEKLRKYCHSFSEDGIRKEFEGRDGASRLSRMLVEECTHLNLWVGKTINPAHQNPDFPMDLSIKLNVIDELVSLMRELGKIVSVIYV
jgi:hypothetical protein